MPDAPSFDVVVVGAGPAGSAAALTLARAGHSVCVVERGPFPGSKNMYGGVVYGRILDTLVPNWWDEVPVQRWITRRATMITTPTQALTIDFRTEAWAQPPYNGATTFRPDFDQWLADKATEAGATLLCSTVATGLLRDATRVVGVATDRPGGDLAAKVVIACDGVNSFLAKEAGLYPHTDPANFTLGVKEVLALDAGTIEERFGLRARQGADYEILGCTGDIPGGGFLYTNQDSLAVGAVLHLPELAASRIRPEEVIAGMKEHPAIAPLVDGGELKEYSAHLIPEAGWDMLPELCADGLLVAGDAAALCLAAGIWLEGVNYAIGSGAAAGLTAHEAIRAGDTSARGLAGYRERLEQSFVLANHRKLQRVQHLVLGNTAQRALPAMACDVVEGLFTVDDPRPKPGLRRLVRRARRRERIPWRRLGRDALDAWRSFG